VLKILKTSSGFSLAELLVAAMIMAVALIALLGGYVTCLELVKLATNTSLALEACQAKMEEIVAEDIDLIKLNFDQIAFDPAGLNGKGVSYIDDTNPDLIKISIFVSWQQKPDKVIGEDSDLDGQIDGGEDANLNNMLDSPAEVTTFLSRR